MGMSLYYSNLIYSNQENCKAKNNVIIFCITWYFTKAKSNHLGVVFPIGLVKISNPLWLNDAISTALIAIPIPYHRRDYWRNG